MVRPEIQPRPACTHKHTRRVPASSVSSHRSAPLARQKQRLVHSIEGRTANDLEGPAGMGQQGASPEPYVAECVVAAAGLVIPPPLITSLQAGKSHLIADIFIEPYSVSQ